MYNPRPIGKMMMKYSLPTGSINKIDLYTAGIEMHLPTIVLHLGCFNTPKKVLCIEKSNIGQQITLNRSVMS